MVRLLVVVDHPAIRRGLLMWLRLAPDITMVGEADDGLSALWQASMVSPDVILVHLESADIDGSELIAAIRRAAPGSEIVILSLTDDVLIRRRLLAAGAAAFVSMHEVKERLLQAIRQAAGRLPAEPERGAGPAGLAPAPKKSGA
jgi:DNA-binding NarL/FixJ family response regulator